MDRRVSVWGGGCWFTRFDEYFSLIVFLACLRSEIQYSQQSFGRISGGSLRADQSEIRPANILCFFVFLSRLSDAKFPLAG
jgi:hypothetical protein